MPSPAPRTNNLTRIATSGLEKGTVRRPTKLIWKRIVPRLATFVSSSHFIALLLKVIHELSFFQ